MYSSGVEDENYLRGIAKTDSKGTALVSDDLPRRLSRPLAPHPFRGLLVGRQSGFQRPYRQDIADRVAASGVQEGLRDKRIRGQPEQPRENLAVDRQCVQRRQGDPPTRDRDRKRQARLRREPHHRHLTNSTSTAESSSSGWTATSVSPVPTRLSPRSREGPDLTVRAKPSAGLEPATPELRTASSRF